MASDSKSQRSQAAQPAKKPTPRGPRRGPLARSMNMDSEQSARVLLIGGVALVVVIALGFIAFGYWNTVIKPRNRTVLDVDGTTVSYNAMKRRMAYELAQNPLYQQAPQLLPQSTMNTLVQEVALIDHAEAEQGVTATDDEVGAQIGAQINAPVGTDQKTYAQALSNKLDEIGLNEAEYRRIQKAQLLEAKIKEKMTNALPAAVPQAKVEVIQTDTEAEANAAADRIRAGEAWDAVAKDVSKETDVQTTGGLHDYGPNGSFDASYNDQAFSLPVGQISTAIASQSGSAFYVIRVDDRSDQPVKDDQKSVIVSKQYNDWLQDLTSRMVILNKFDTKSQNDALVNVFSNQPAPTPIIPGVDTSTGGGGAGTEPQAPAAPAGDGSGGNPPVPDAPVAPDGGNGQ